MFRVTVAGMEAMKEAAEAFTSAWEEIETPLETWLEFQEAPPTTADGRDERREARDELDSGLDAILDAIRDLAALLPKGDR